MFFKRNVLSIWLKEATLFKPLLLNSLSSGPLYKLLNTEWLMLNWFILLILMKWLTWYLKLTRIDKNRLGSRFWVNETSQISEHYSDQIQAVMKQRSWLIFCLMYLSMIKKPKHEWHAVFDTKICATDVLRPEFSS